MKKIISVCVLSAVLATSQAQTVKTPSASTSQSVKQEFALTSIEVNYSRPNKKGRTIFGDLVPYGAVWRTGANNATTVQFADEVMIGGKKVPAGKYGLVTIPNAGEWTVILTKQLDVMGAAAYKQDQDVVRVRAVPQDLPFPIETFTMMFNNVGSTSVDLVMLWDMTAVTLPISMDVDSRVMAQIDNAMNKYTRPYYQSAMYYMENGKDLNKASQWFDKAIEQNPGAYWVWHQKANCLAKLGKKNDAVAAANKSMELAKAAKNGDYVTLNEKLLKSLK